MLGNSIKFASFDDIFSAAPNLLFSLLDDVLMLLFWGFYVFVFYCCCCCSCCSAGGLSRENLQILSSSLHALSLLAKSLLDSLSTVAVAVVGSCDLGPVVSLLTQIHSGRNGLRTQIHTQTQANARTGICRKLG